MLAVLVLFNFILKSRHHNKVLTCEVHSEGANEQRYMRYNTISSQALGQCKNIWLHMGRRGGDSKTVTRGPREPKSQGRPGTGGAKAKDFPTKGWRGHVGRGWAGACLGGTHMLAP